MALPDGPKCSLYEGALEDIITRGGPILGTLTDLRYSGKMTAWMSRIPDDTKLVHMNLPGTHDTCTWNYTPELQEDLERYTGPIPDSTIYRCQQQSIFKMLNAGVRVLDLRYSWNPGHDTIGFFHSMALLSPTTRMEDVFFGLYAWLDIHPSEAILVSLNYEPGIGRRNDEKLQAHLYHIFNGTLAKQYWVQTKSMLGTLGDARGKLTLIQRFDYDKLPQHLTHRIGIHLNPAQWTVNGREIEITYNPKEDLRAYIQDHYHLAPSNDSNPQSCIEEKLAVTIAHLERAIDSSLHPDQLFISFSSAAFRIEEPSLVPKAYAIGDPNEDIATGVNHGLLDWLRANEGKRFGIIFLDFFDALPELVEAILDQSPAVLSKI